MSQIYLVIAGVFVISSAFLLDKSIFLLLDIIKYSLRYLLPILMLIWFLYILIDSGQSLIFVKLALYNVMQIVIWYLIEKRWNRVSNEQFYLTVTKRGNFKGLIVIIPIVGYIFFIDEVILSIIDVLKTFSF
jgi:hypothetical protein